MVEKSLVNVVKFITIAVNVGLKRVSDVFQNHFFKSRNSYQQHGLAR